MVAEHCAKTLIGSIVRHYDRSAGQLAQTIHLLQHVTLKSGNRSAVTGDKESTLLQRAIEHAFVEVDAQVLTTLPDPDPRRPGQHAKDGATCGAQCLHSKACCE